jgi:uncharacterized protein (TIGR02996 family)
MAEPPAGAGQALLRAIIDNPADEVARLVFADWLDEHGEADRAEFIRVQVEAARAPCGHDRAEALRRQGGGAECRTCALRRREHDLLSEANAFLWGLGPAARAASLELPLATLWHLDGRPPAEKISTLFRKGFVEAVALPAQAWLEHGPALLRAAPLCAVRLCDKKPWQTASSRPRERAFWFWQHSEPWDAIPNAIFALLAGEKYGESDCARRYPSVAEAWADLSAACLAHARGEGRPPPPAA